MLFGYLILKHVLSSKNALNIHKETAVKRMEIAEKRLQRLEAEACKKGAAGGNGMYDDDE